MAEITIPTSLPGILLAAIHNSRLSTKRNRPDGNPSGRKGVLMHELHSKAVQPVQPRHDGGAHE
jgi:hypothetical protein